MIYLAWIAGMFITWVVLLNRAGVGPIAMWGVPEGSRLHYFIKNLQWHLTTSAKVFFWWIVLPIWLLQGRPASPWKVVEVRGGVPIVRRVIAAEAAEESAVG